MSQASAVAALRRAVAADSQVVADRAAAASADEAVDLRADSVVDAADLRVAVAPLVDLPVRDPDASAAVAGLKAAKQCSAIARPADGKGCAAR